MASRIIAIGDPHGCSKALDALLKACEPRQDDTVVVMGDFIDRGEDVPGVIDQLLALSETCDLIPLMGNHEEMLLGILGGQFADLAPWLSFGGKETLEGYGATTPWEIPPEHVQFMQSCRYWAEMDHHFFVHANYNERKKFPKMDATTLLWESLPQRMPGPHRSGKKAIVGHTSQKNGEILNLGYLLCIDTFCYGGGWLTAIDLTSGAFWQADVNGRIREAEEPPS